MTKGNPGNDTPATSYSPDLRCTSYHTLGMEWLRCMSLESRGFPVVVCAPDTTQLFEPAMHVSQRSSGPCGDVPISSRIFDSCSSSFSGEIGFSSGRDVRGANCCPRGSADGGRSRHE